MTEERRKVSVGDEIWVRGVVVEETTPITWTVFFGQRSSSVFVRQATSLEFHKSECATKHEGAVIIQGRRYEWAGDKDD